GRARWILEISCTLIRPVQWMSRVWWTDSNNLVVSDEDIGPEAKVREGSLHRFRVEDACLQSHVVFDYQSVYSTIKCVVPCECSAILSAEKLERFQNAVEVEFFEPEGDDSRRLVLAPPSSHLLGLLDGEIVEELLDRASRGSDCAELFRVRFPLYIPSKCFVRNLVHTDPLLAR